MGSPLQTRPCAAILNLVPQVARRVLPDRFGRLKGSMPPVVAVLSILVMASSFGGSSYAVLMGILNATWGDSLTWKGAPATSTFCRARAKVSAEMFASFRDALLIACAPFINNAVGLQCIRGRRLVAIDGSWVDAPNSSLLRRLLGIHRIGPKASGMKRPQVLLVMLTDALTRQPIARVVLKGTGSERDAAEQLAQHLRRDDILLADRGYQGRKMLEMITKIGCDYCLRVCAGASAMRELKRLHRARIRDATIDIHCANSIIPVRHVRISSGPGRNRRNVKRQAIHLITNLDSSFSVTRIGRIYQCRWGIETMFRELKKVVNKQEIRSRTMAGVIQELDARLLHLTIAAIIDLVTAHHHRIQPKHSIAACTTNRAVIYAIISISLIDNDRTITARAGTSIEHTAKRAEPRRPGRYAPRKPKMFKR